MNLAVATGGAASILEQMGDYTGATLLYQNALSKAVDAFGAEHPTSVGLKNRMDELLIKIADTHIN